MAPLPNMDEGGKGKLLTLERIFDNPDLEGKSPRSCKLSPDGTRATYLLGREDDGNQMDLWEYVIRTDVSRMLVNSTELLGHRSEEVSEDEQARRERERIASSKGILSYCFSCDGKMILFPLSGALYVCNVESRAVEKLPDCGGFATDQCFSPMGRYVSYISDRNLFIVDLATKITTQLTSEGGGNIAWGVAEFVAQEELRRMTGYWWAPSDDFIVAARIDESHVPIARRCDIYQAHSTIVEQRYPAAGGPNVGVKLALLSPTHAGVVAWMDLGDTEDIYLARVDWLYNGAGVVVQRLSRDQRVLDLLLYRVTGCEVAPPTLLLKEESKTWINIHSDFRSLSNGDFLWASEKTGYKHLYHHTAAGAVTTLTCGSWVVDEVVGVAQGRGLVFFTGNMVSVLEQRLYAVDFAGKNVQLLTQEPGWHTVTFNKDATIFIDSWSDTCTPPQLTLRSVEGKTLKTLCANAVAPGHPLYPYTAQLTMPLYGHIDIHNGTRLHYQLRKPACIVEGERYPVYVRVYGGPHAQLVQRRWLGKALLVDAYMAQQGFVVFTLDNRGSARRGKEFEEVLQHRLGQTEVQDQLAGIQWLGRQTYVDAARVGVFGWSYGGYMALMLLAKGGDSIACGVSVAPVTDWRLYDTAYTERYLGHPSTQAEGYSHASAMAHVNKIESGKLLLVHGMADDNVLFSHSTLVMHALQRRGCVFRLMTYPGERHAIGSTYVRLHVWREIVAMFCDRLGVGQSVL